MTSAYAVKHQEVQRCKVTGFTVNSTTLLYIPPSCIAKVCFYLMTMFTCNTSQEDVRIPIAQTRKQAYRA